MKVGQAQRRRAQVGQAVGFRGRTHRPQSQHACQTRGSGAIHWEVGTPLELPQWVQQMQAQQPQAQQAQQAQTQWMQEPQTQKARARQVQVRKAQAGSQAEVREVHPGQAVGKAAEDREGSQPTREPAAVRAAVGVATQLSPPPGIEVPHAGRERFAPAQPVRSRVATVRPSPWIPALVLRLGKEFAQAPRVLLTEAAAETSFALEHLRAPKTGAC